MALDYSTFAHGATVFPVANATTNTFLRDADPAIYWCLDFFEHCINRYLGQRLVNEALACGAPIDAPVAYALPDSPASYLTEEQARFPLLAIERVRDQLGDRTVTWRQSANEWRLHYVLPPLSPGQRERIKPMLRAVARVIDARIEAGTDAQWRGGARPFGGDYANLQEITLTSVDYGDWDAGDGMAFPSVSLSLSVVERDMLVGTAFESLEGFDVDQTYASFPPEPEATGVTAAIGTATGPITELFTGETDPPLVFTANCQATDEPGDLVYVSAPPVAGVQQVAKVDPTNYAKMPAVGILVAKTSTTLCTVCYFGVLEVLELTDSGRLFVGKNGKLTSTPPTGPVFLQVFGVSFQSEKLLVRPSYEMTRLIGP